MQIPCRRASAQGRGATAQGPYGIRPWMDGCETAAPEDQHAQSHAATGGCGGATTVTSNPAFVRADRERIFRSRIEPRSRIARCPVQPLAAARIAGAARLRHFFGDLGTSNLTLGGSSPSQRAIPITCRTWRFRCAGGSELISTPRECSHYEAIPPSPAVISYEHDPPSIGKGGTAPRPRPAIMRLSDLPPANRKRARGSMLSSRRQMRAPFRVPRCRQSMRGFRHA